MAGLQFCTRIGGFCFFLVRLFLPSLTCKKGAKMTPFCINFPMNMPYYVAKHIVKPGMRQYILWPLSSYCPPPPVLSDTQYHRVYVIRLVVSQFRNENVHQCANLPFWGLLIYFNIGFCADFRRISVTLHHEVSMSQQKEM
jgi:hypothetical protein